MTQHAHILIVGDSLSWEHYSSLVQLLGVSTHQGFQHQSKAFQEPIGQAVCRGRTKVWFLRDDRLQNLHTVLAPPPHTQSQALDSNHNEYTAGLIPNILVLNRGAHYVNDTVLLDDLRSKTFPAVQRWLQHCQTIYGPQHCHFLWRTSVPGHAKCDEAFTHGKNQTTTFFQKPISRLATAEAYVQRRSNYDTKTLAHHWYDFKRQNHLVEELVNEFFSQQKASKMMMILDAYYLNILRPDDHRAHQNDCLHNCYPGKMDVYSRWLLHAIQYNLQQYRSQHPNNNHTFQTDDSVIELNRVRRFQTTKQKWLPTNTSTVYDKPAWTAILYRNRPKHKTKPTKSKEQSL